MPSSGDPDNLIPNLDTLSILVVKPAGSKLSYNKRNGRFSIQEPGKVASVTRTLKKESVLDEEKFGAPIRELFAAAHEAVFAAAHAAVEDHNIPHIHIHQGHINAALAGLRALADTYAGTYAGAQDKLATLEAVYRDAQVGLQKDPAGVIALREKYRNYLLFGFAQVMFLPLSNPGVCYSFTVHWARRILLGKPNWGFSKKGQSPPMLTLDDAQTQRMMQKVHSAIRPMQAELKSHGHSKWANVVMTKASDGTNDPYKKYFTALSIYRAGGPEVAINARPGSEVMQQAVQIAMHEQAMGIAQTGRGPSVFIVSLRKPTTGGHAIGIHLETTPYGSIEQGALHFFDPNFGEFLFPPGSDEALATFLDEWWQIFCRTEFNRFELQCVSLQ